MNVKQFIAILMAVFVAVLPAITQASQMPPAPPAAARSANSMVFCPAPIAENKITSRPGTIDIYSTDLVRKTVEGRISTMSGDVVSGIQISGDYKTATLTFGVGADIRSVTVDVNSMTMADLAPLMELVQQTRLTNPAAAAAVDGYRCRLAEQFGSSDPAKVMKDLRKQIRQACGVPIAAEANFVQTTAALMQCQDHMQSASFVPATEPDDVIWGWALLVAGPLALYALVNCGGCTYGCGNCFCC